MKKRFLSIIAYLYLFCSIFSVSYCTSIKNVTVGEVETIDSGKEASIYDVEISWNNMKFTYNETKDVKWDSNENKYNIVIENEWINEDNIITVKNFSNKSITASFKYKQTNKNIDITGKFDKNKVVIEKNKVENVKFNISGKISSDIVDYVKVGRITISMQ